jgi:hypothetical protein
LNEKSFAGYLRGDAGPPLPLMACRECIPFALFKAPGEAANGVYISSPPSGGKMALILLDDLHLLGRQRNNDPIRVETFLQRALYVAKQGKVVLAPRPADQR